MMRKQKQQDPLAWSFQHTGALYKMKTTALLLRQVREKVEGEGQVVEGEEEGQGGDGVEEEGQGGEATCSEEEKVEATEETLSVSAEAACGSKILGDFRPTATHAAAAIGKSWVERGRVMCVCVGSGSTTFTLST